MNAVYVFLKYWYFLKVAVINSQNVKECFCIRILVQFVSDNLVDIKISILVAQNCVCDHISLQKYFLLSTVQKYHSYM